MKYRTEEDINRNNKIFISGKYAGKLHVVPESKDVMYSYRICDFKVSKSSYEL